ncbi:hypothetical protein M878_20855 [Streptomyces roseochromogenus subsp. oscitans DS 12.976]|uniref:Uncharacterized protein n=1 Tax=Streptomyces roseochromogenus subsp. oscitans DS 12.976 TaxID=1352936 RepID=V6KJS0_STRRC|nr:hypothetical protein M878_20855 [Streptomyces roseochromogenus subsp. oscitans DS 12.976]
MSPVLEMVNTSEEIGSLSMNITESVHGPLEPAMFVHLSDVVNTALAVAGVPTHAAVHCAVAALTH